MTFADALARFFESYTAPAGAPRVEIRRGLFQWKAVPLEWNCAKAFAAQWGCAVRMVAGNGAVQMQYSPADLRGPVKS